MALSVYLFVLLSIICIANSAADPLGNFCNDQSSSSNTQVLANIDSLLSKLVQTTPQTGFSASSLYRSSKDQQIYGLAQCRADVSSKDCSSCIKEAAKEIRIRCSNQTDAQIWYDQCFLRYSSNDFWGQVDTGYGIFSTNVENVTEPERFNKKLGAVIDGIGSGALMAVSKGLGKGESKVSPLVNVYALVECTRDLSPFSCAQCLATAYGNFQTFCNHKKGCQILYGSCRARYEIYPFF